MSKLHERIKNLCEERNMKIANMCRATNIPTGTLSDLKSGRTKSLSAVNLSKIANYFDVSVDYLLGNTDIKKEPAAVSGDKLIPGYDDLSEDNKAKAREYIALLLNSQCNE